MDKGTTAPRPAAERKGPYSYGVYGLSEWEVLIPAGRAKLRLRFTGGETGGYGATPARFTTANSSIAALIEESEYFKSRRIVRLG